MNNDIVYKIASLAKKYGGVTYYVGGCVRDYFLGIENKDIDIEIHGIDEEALLVILKQLGKPLEYGKSFGIYSLSGYNIEIALPRKEKKTGEGHRDFDVEIDPYIGTKEAARRRDFTINSMMLDAITGELVDNYNGLNDLRNKIIRHVDKNTFVEDPLRVFRACQFAARFNFLIDKETIELCKNINTEVLSKERIEGELKKALLNSKKPSSFFNYLKEMNQLHFWFSELNECVGYKQNPKKHPEGDVFEHTMLSLDEATLYHNFVSNPYNYMVLVLVHDFGKLKTKVDTEEGVHFYGHENYLLDIKTFLDRVISSNDTKKYVLEMVPRHMRGHKIFKDDLSVYESNKWFDGVTYPKDLVYFAVADKANHRDPKRLMFLLKRYDIYLETINKSEISGKDLIALGIKANNNFSNYLKYARELTLQGLNKNDILEMVKKYIKDNEK